MLTFLSFCGLVVASADGVQLGHGDALRTWLRPELVVSARLEAVQVKGAGAGAMGTFCLTRRSGDEGRTASAGGVAGAEPEEVEGEGDLDGEGMQLRDAKHRP
eukprot:1868383-Rhodomonas_salina.2